ncbi:MAG: response regulator transcription factor [Clostridia bacterium]|nr:response regulator transcription factor [Clostridia bacterium]
MDIGHILIIEDEEHIVELIKFNLENNGYKVSYALDGQKGLEMIENEQPDLVLLDLMLPKVDGIDICNRVKNNKNLKEIPIIMLTAKSGETDKIVGLEIGADDYITKPFSVRELLARIKVVLRRYQNTKSSDMEGSLTVDDLVIDIDKHEVSREGIVFELTLKEFELLRILALNKGRVLSRSYLLDEIWGYDYFGETRTVDVHIRHLRSKIEEGSGKKYIETVRGVGYKIK